MAHTIVIIVSEDAGALVARQRGRYAVPVMSPTWIWTQFAIVLFVVIGMVIAIVKLV